MFVGGFISIFAYAYVARTAHSALELRVWLAFMMAAFAFRFASQKLFLLSAKNEPDFDAVFYERVYAFGLSLTAVGWGVAGSVLLPEKAEFVLVLGLINIGLIAGASSAYSISRLSLSAVMLPMSLPLAVMTFLRGHETLTAMGVMIGLFALAMARLGHKRSDFVLQAWKIAEEKDRLSRDLIDAQAKILQSTKMAALGQMAGGIAHEINTPLAIISVCAQTIQEASEEAEPSLPNIREAAVEVESTVARIAKIVGGLKNFSRQDQSDPPRVIEVETLISETLSFCQERLKRMGVAIEVSRSSETRNGLPLTVSGHSAQLSQVLLNLFNNAADAVEPLDEKWISVVIDHDETCLRLRVSDSGAGIAPEIRARLMEPFFTTKAFGKGTGLGLSVAHGIAAAHGGRLTLDEESPRTCFVLELPLYAHGRKSKSAA